MSEKKSLFSAAQKSHQISQEDFIVTLPAVFHLVIIAPRCPTEESMVLLVQSHHHCFPYISRMWSRWDVCCRNKNKSSSINSMWNARHQWWAATLKMGTRLSSWLSDFHLSPHVCMYAINRARRKCYRWYSSTVKWFYRGSEGTWFHNRQQLHVP